MNNVLIKQLNWRYAVKKFNPEKKINSDQIHTLIEAMRLTASSYGLQPYRVLLVTNPEIRQKLLEHSWGQKQIVDASHLFVICNYTEISDDLVSKYLANISAVRNTKEDKLEAFGKQVISKIAKLPHPQEWAKKQCYIVLGNLLTSCALMGVDACPMEGFIPEKYNEILNLGSQKLNAVLAVPVGFRDQDDKYAELPKVRKPADNFLTII